LPRRTLEIARNSLDLYRFFERYKDCKEATIDVETFKAIPYCIGIAFNSWHAISVPLHEFPHHDRAYAWKLLAEFLATNDRLIAHNGKFDEKRCREVGLKWRGLWFDTMLAWATLFPEFPKRLQFVSSILTEEPYYKDEGKEFDFKRDNPDKLLLYNAKDAAVEFECKEKIYKMLEEENLLDFFFEKVMPLHKLYSEIEDNGILVDQKVRRELKEKYENLFEEKRRELIELIVNGDETVRESFEKFNVNSWKQVRDLVYGYLRCPPRADTSEDTLKSLMNNAVKDERRKKIIKLILEARKISKSIGTYIDAKPSADGRMRTECVLTLETGRTSTQVRKPPVVAEQEGMSLQTMTKHEDVSMESGGADLRAMFISDPGYVFIEADLSQAEDRVVCVLAEDWEALTEYERKEFKVNKHGIKDDRHTKTAMLVCSLPFEEISDYYRQIGKRIRHAGNYGVGKHEAMLALAKYNIFVSEWRTGKMLETFHSSNPKIRAVFHEGIQRALSDNGRVLFNPFGRRRQFFEKWGDQLFKEAYAQIPQSTVTDQTKFALVRIRSRIEHFYPVLESHDSFLALCRESEVEMVKSIVKEEMEKPINFSKCSLSRDYDLVIPCEIKVGKRWVEASEKYPDGMRKSG